MKHAAAVVSLIVLLLAGHSTVAAQGLGGTPATTVGDAVVMTIEVDTPVESIFGFTRTTIAPGGSARFSAGSGPALRFVERGSLQLSDQGDALKVIPPSPATPAGDEMVDAGTAFIVDAGGSIELRNDGADPATILELLSAADATVANEVDVSHLVLAQRDYPLPAGTVTVTLSQQTLEPGKQFDWPADPAVTTLYPLQRSDAFLITGKGVNRGTHTIAIYALTIAPVTG